MISVKDIALGNIKLRKSNAEKQADLNLQELLKNEEVKKLYVTCKSLMVDIAKADFRGEDSTKLKEKYATTKTKIQKLVKKQKIDLTSIKPKYTCDKCRDTGRLGKLDCDCLKREISNILFSQCGLNMCDMPNFSDTTFDLYKDNTTKEKVEHLYKIVESYIEKYSETTKKFIVICGNVGVGKTHLLKCAVKKAIDYNLITYYTTAFNLNQDMLAYHCAAMQDKPSIISKYIDSDILCIDDLGTEVIYKNVTVEYLYLILNERQQRGKNTIITTNLTIEQIRDTYDDRIMSRLVSKKDAILVEIDSEDLRLKKAK